MSRLVSGTGQRISHVIFFRLPRVVLGRRTPMERREFITLLCDTVVGWPADADRQCGRGDRIEWGKVR
jgi:hypothetical protein